MESDNPYAAHNLSGGPIRDVAGNAELSASILGHIRVVSILMIVHGILLCVVGLFLIGLAIAMPYFLAMQPNAIKQQPGGPDMQQMKWIMGIMYGSMGLAGLVPGIVQLVAGIYNLSLKKRMFGIVALIFGAVSIATCYCTPTAIGLLVYGLIIYLHDTSKQAFALREAGRTREEIQALAGYR